MASWQRNLKPGDIVLLSEDEIPRNSWSLAKIQTVYPSTDGLVRRITVLKGDSALDDKGKRTTKAIYLDRPISKLVLLIQVDESISDCTIPDEESFK